MDATARRALVEGNDGFDPIPPGESGRPIGRSRNAMPASGSHVIAAEANVLRTEERCPRQGGHMIRKVFSRLLILVALLAPAVRAESPTWTARFDVDLGVIHDVAAGGGVAYAATYNGVFRSEDGRRWEEAGLQGRGIGLVVVDAAGESVFAVDFSGSLWVLSLIHI